MQQYMNGQANDQGMRTLDADVSLLNIKTPARNSGPGMQSVRPVNDSQADYRGYNP